MEQSLMDKLTILADSAKYDVACTSSGASHPAKRGTIGSCYAPGCCHAFTADGRCVSLLKVLMSNCCAFDCSYCVNRKSNDVPRATFSPRELAELTIEFYRRNYIEGLFLSSAVLGPPTTPPSGCSPFCGCCGTNITSAATSMPRPSPAPAPSSSSRWATSPTASASTSSCPASRASIFSPPTRAATPSSSP